MAYLIRPVQADEWKRFKELRLAALADPVARMAFHETFEEAAAQPPEFWQRRAERSDDGGTALTLIGEGPDGSWGGMVVVLRDTDGEVPQARIVGVYVRPEHRGTGLSRELFEAALDWSWSLSEPAVARVRLWVHAANEPAIALYRALGFVETGRTMADPKDAAVTEREMALARR
ncbi:GNAT family N-acetyltransferase [Streptomyces pinistramenti]|uniref:GNAT family N-acetyltransferase n=1 Tax=Streptomyces pinistramenti TaxID=2884812 RepID=UPI001D085718|nr:GNAT family protein [Streptomyces pinistramenti]MCB5911692.1 GNAT family N-acetyltransferase [Streptomyces pinistramenti]